MALMRSGVRIPQLRHAITSNQINRHPLLLHLGEQSQRRNCVSTIECLAEHISSMSKSISSGRPWQIIVKSRKNKSYMKRR